MPSLKYRNSRLISNKSPVTLYDYFDTTAVTSISIFAPLTVKPLAATIVLTGLLLAKYFSRIFDTILKSFIFNRLAILFAALRDADSTSFVKHHILRPLILLV